MARTLRGARSAHDRRPSFSSATVPWAGRFPIVSDAWSFLIIREAFFGAQRFEEFRTALGLPRGTLSERLKRLTVRGIFRQVHYSDTSSGVEYHLTRCGMDLYPSFVALIRFGDRWLCAGRKGRR